MASTDEVSWRRKNLERCPPWRFGRYDALFDLAYALCKRYKEERKIDDLNEAIDLHRAALELRPVENKKYDWFGSLHTLALCLSRRYDEQGTVNDLEEAVTLGREALELRPPGHPGRDVPLHSLAFYLNKRFEKQATTGDLQEAISLSRAVLELRPPGHPRRDATLADLAYYLNSRFNKRASIRDLEEAISLSRAVLELRPPGHPRRDATLYKLAYYLNSRFDKQAAICDLEEAISLSRAALELHPPGHPDRSATLDDLAYYLNSRFNKRASIRDLEEAISLSRAALELCPPGHPRRDATLYKLAYYINSRFDKRASIRDLEEAISLSRAALELRPPGHPRRDATLYKLAYYLKRRFDKQAAICDLEEAISLSRAALELHPPGHPDRSATLHNLIRCLNDRFEKQAAACDLEEAISLSRAILDLHPPGHPHRDATLHDLAVYLNKRFARQATIRDLEEAISLRRAALELFPLGHSDRGKYLYHLARDLWTRFQKQVDMPGLHGANSLHQTASVARPTSTTDLASSLLKLSLHLWDRFQKEAAMTDMDDAICCATYALELRLPRDSHHGGAWFQRPAQGTGSNEPVVPGREIDNLGALVNCFVRHRSGNQHAMVGLNEDITLCRYVLQSFPTDHPGRASSLHSLAECLAHRFRQQSAAADLDEAILLEQEVLQVLIPGDPGYDISRCSLTAYLHMKVESQVAMTSSNASPVAHFDVEQLIRNVAFETLKTMPTRLLHTHTGALCNRHAQLTQFMSSQQYKRLVLLCTTCGPDQRMELVHIAILKYFQYVTLSHRWGEDEPSLRDIEGHLIYDMSAKEGFKKLQAFCLVACQRDFLWAWSDTCCIDKDSSAELQEAIGSMFAWYRQSSLTIVYLSDVPDTGSLGNSEWFRRGWTLQELLAPRTVLFYTQNWSLYKNLTSSNHKADIVVLEELERATGIESRFLTHFSPGTDDARSRLQWASLRRTTRPEDIAYSLFGIFNLHLPVLYGELAGKALGRLLAEIISQSGDISVLDWVGEASQFHSCFPAQITSFQTLPLLRPQHNAEKPSAAISQRPSSFEKLRNLRGSFILPRFLSRFFTSSNIAYHVPAVHLRTPDSYSPGDVYDFHSLTRVPLPRFLNRRLILPCIAHCVTVVHPKGSDPSAPSYTYNIRAFGLRPLEITLPNKLEVVTRLQGSLQLVRPWHSELPGSSAKLDAVTEEQLFSALERPFNALLLRQLPHNEHRRIASSTCITAQPIDRASILKSKIRIFNIV